MTKISEAKEILEKEYHRDNFLHIVREILLTDYVNDEHEVDFSNSIFSNVTQLGESRVCDDLVVYEVVLNEGVQNRRIAITQEMFRIMRGQAINNALVAFSNSDGRNYRISLLTSKYEFEGEKIVKKLSNPRRYSYSLGYGTKTKTPYDFLIKAGKVRSLEELIDRFSVEVVNKQFYNDIATRFTELVGGERDRKTYSRLLKLQDVQDGAKFAEFAVRLIGRVVFCWFLKEKKNMLGISLMPDEILSRTAVEQNENYYNNVLEPLFFELLNTKQTRRKDKFGKLGIYTQVPYLNGGLFSPHTDDLYRYSPITQGGEKDHVNIPDEWFKNLFKVLEQYNFTVDENTTYDVELSVDPEMLGRIFESLLAEINPETGESARKNTGSFYTPRDIVDYMVDSSLYEYLFEKTNIDEKVLKSLISYDREDRELRITAEDKKNVIDALFTLTVIDPACGSGAFPIGMLQKIVYLLQELDPETKLWFEKITAGFDPVFKAEIKNKFDAKSFDYIRKIGVIQKSIFGVDIQPIAVEIARLRCFLSLIIEENVDDNKDNRGVHPLPNLDFKFVTANTLIGLEDGRQVRWHENRAHIEELKAVREEYFNPIDMERRNELRLEFADIQKKMLQTTITEFNRDASSRYKSLYNWEPFKNESSGWFDPEWMFGVKGGFDIVIGNPPYVQVPKGMVPVAQFPYSEGKDKGKQNLYKVFIECAYNLSKQNGIACLIAQSSLMCDLSSMYTRQLLLDNTVILRIIEFPKKSKDPAAQVFESVLQGTCIYVSRKTKVEDYSFGISIGNNVRTLSQLDFEFVKKAYIKKLYPETLYFPLVNKNNFNIMEKIIRSSIMLNTLLKDVRQGDLNVTTSRDKFSTEPTDVRMLRGRNIHRYRIIGEAEEYVEENFLRDVVKANSNNQYLVGQAVTGTVDERRLHFAVTEKHYKFLFGHSAYKLLLKDQRLNLFVLAVLNSKLMDWYFRKTSTNNNVMGYELVQLPVPKCDDSKIQEIIQLVDEIMLLKKENKDAHPTEKKIDNIMYKIYNLTPEEIALVEKMYCS